MPNRVPNVTFKTRVRNDAIEGPNPFEWKDLTTSEIFDGKRVVVFSLPGAFTPTCSTSHLPRYEELYAEFKELGIDAVICLSVNDAFTMYQWGISQNAENVFLLPDGNGEFSRKNGYAGRQVELGLRHALLALFDGRRQWRDRTPVRRARFRRQLPNRPVRSL